MSPPEEDVVVLDPSIAEAIARATKKEINGNGKHSNQRLLVWMAVALLTGGGAGTFSLAGFTNGVTKAEFAVAVARTEEVETNSQHRAAIDKAQIEADRKRDDERHREYAAKQETLIKEVERLKTHQQHESAMNAEMRQDIKELLKIVR